MSKVKNNTTVDKLVANNKQKIQITFQEFIDNPKCLQIGKIITTHMSTGNVFHICYYWVQTKEKKEEIYQNFTFIPSRHKNLIMQPSDAMFSYGISSFTDKESPSGGGSGGGAKPEKEVAQSTPTDKAQCLIFKNKNTTGETTPMEELHFQFHEALHKQRQDLILTVRSHVGYSQTKSYTDPKEARDAFNEKVHSSVWYPRVKQEVDANAKNDFCDVIEYNMKKPYANYQFVEYADKTKEWMNTKIFLVNSAGELRCPSLNFIKKNVRFFYFFPSFVLSDFVKDRGTVSCQLRMREVQVWPVIVPQTSALHDVLPEALDDNDTSFLNPSKRQNEDNAQSDCEQQIQGMNLKDEEDKGEEAEECELEESNETTTYTVNLQNLRKR